MSQVYYTNALKKQYSWENYILVLRTRKYCYQTNATVWSSELTSIGETAILVFLNVILLREGYKFVDMTIPCIAIVNKISCHRYRSYEFSRVIKQYVIRKNDLSKKEKMLQTYRQALRKNASKKRHFSLISRLESRACEAMYRSRGKPV